ncbi:hypothetical protein H2198_009183 [Neophaeococcomyces mojaviensis]|uniref:Uncharacterized protein n=1 Tax=Neophaeococcomyces mojaviensis TaxID=3383035 RepID=A0ACC2ZVH9_9EURO|nr:hypothetical protein H2198_009183 [Knufia sp. JES_112]
MSTQSPMIRLAPLPFSHLPNHPSFETDPSNSRPDVLRFALTLLNQGRALVQPTQFNLHFKSHSWKPSPPSNNEVEILSTSVSASDLASIPWSSEQVLRPKPVKLEDEFWYARRSNHHNLSVKRNAPGTAAWNEFIYGLRDQHSKHEFDFTPAIYDARLICEWNEELNRLLSGLTHQETDSKQPNYSHATMSIYEMCHKLPSVVGPRCFPVLVVTASCSENEFVAVTIPVDIRSFDGSFYSSGRNKKEGIDAQTKKAVTLGEYCAVERVHRFPTEATHSSAEGKVHSHTGDGEDIEWIMATASNTRGNIPIVMQRMGIPGAIAKDVGLFLKWIHNVPEEEVRTQQPGTSTAI